MSCLEKCHYLVVSLDEAFNEVSKKWYGFSMRYLDGVCNKVTVRYLISAFMEHNSSEDVLESLNPIVIEKNHTNIYRWSKYQLEVSRTL